MKDYLTYENNRNRRNVDLFEDMLRRAFGSKAETLIAHHLTYEDGAVHGEVPSADTLIFCHEIMGRIFGERAIPIMRELASVPSEQRDALLSAFLYSGLQPPQREAPAEQRYWTSEVNA